MDNEDDQWPAFPFKDKLETVSSMSKGLGTDEARIGFFFKREEMNKYYDLLSNTFCILLKNGKRQFTYESGRVAIPNMLTANTGIWSDGVAHFGGPQWHESNVKRGLFLPHPAKGFKKVGNIRDFEERRIERSYCFNPDRPWDVQLVEWGHSLFCTDLMRLRTVQPGPIEPTLLCPVPYGNSLEWLTLRKDIPHVDAHLQSIQHVKRPRNIPNIGSMNLLPLHQVVEQVVNRRRYAIFQCISELCAPGDGVLTRSGPRSYSFKGTDAEPDGCVFQLEMGDPSSLVRAAIRSTFGQDLPVEMYPLFPDSRTKQTEVRVHTHLPLYTPLKEQAANPDKKFTIEHLKKTLSPAEFDALCCMCVLSTTADLDGVECVNADVAYGSKEPFVYKGVDYPRVQRVENNPRSLKSISPSVIINMLEVPNNVHHSHSAARPAVQHVKRLHAVVAAVKPQTPAVEEKVESVQK